MSMKPQPIPEIAAETIRVLRTAFPKGNLYIHLRDTLGTIYQDELFDDLYPGRGQQAFCGKLNEKMKRYNMRHAPGLYRRSEQYEVLNEGSCFDEYNIGSSEYIHPLLPTTLSVRLHALDACSEGLTNMAIDQQIDHNDDGNNPAAYYGKR